MQSNPVAAQNFMQDAMDKVDLGVYSNKPKELTGKVRSKPPAEQQGAEARKREQQKQRARANAKAAMRKRRLANA
jgi:hypothetical protein